MKIFTGFLFNHDSPLRSEDHINQKIAKTIKRIKSGEDIKLEVGSPQVKKEFNFAGDIVEAIWALVNQDSIFECVIGCGISYSIMEWIETCFSILNMDWKEHTIILDGFNPEYNSLVSRPFLIKETGWVPKTSFFELAKKMME